MTISGCFAIISGHFVDYSRPFPAHFRPIPDHFRPFRQSSDQFRQFPGLLSTNSRSSDTQGRHNRGPSGHRNRSIVRTVPDHSRAVQHGATGSKHRKKETHTQRRPFPLHFTPIFTRLPTISWPFQTKYHHHTRTTQGRYNRGPPGHQNTDNRHTAQSQPSRTTHGRYNMGPQDQKSATTATHTD